MRGPSQSRTPLAIGIAALVVGLMCRPATSWSAAQSGPGAVVRLAASSHVTIPYLANASKPADLDYAAAECDMTPDGLTMTCRFRQLFLTPVSFDATTCAVTSNGYERTFRRAVASASRWISEDAPQGACGLVETHTLDDGGGTRWTLTIATRPADAGASRACQSEASEKVVYDWRTMKRALPCSHVQPGMLER